MILDSSALVAIVFREPAWERLFDVLSSATSPGIGAPTLAETSAVLCARLKIDASTRIRRLLDELDCQIVPFGADHWTAAAGAYFRFGKGRHRAALNFGDCLTYAVAALAAEPLLCTGNDFRKTDLELVDW